MKRGAICKKAHRIAALLIERYVDTGDQHEVESEADRLALDKYLKRLSTAHFRKASP